MSNHIASVCIVDVKQLGGTLWWRCPACGRINHATRSEDRESGADFSCRASRYEKNCSMRHSVVWGRRGEPTEQVQIVSYDRHLEDKSMLPFLAQIEV